MAVEYNHVLTVNNDDIYLAIFFTLTSILAKSRLC